MPQLTIIADDLTGAADTGSSFAAAGFATAIPLTGMPSGAIDVISRSTESRDLDASAAARAFEEIVSGLLVDEPRWLYKKIDSALRGHPRDELLALMEMTGSSRALVAPAIPGQGRTTVGGRQHVGGVPLESSHLGGPGSVSDLKALFANDRSIPVRLLDLATIRARPEAIQTLFDDGPPGITVADAQTDDDLLALALAARDSNLRILCGAAGFAQQLARTLPLVASRPRLVVHRQRLGPVLVIAGSQHAATARQVSTAGEAGAKIVTLPQRLIDEPAATASATIAQVAGHLKDGRAVVVTTTGLTLSPHGQQMVAERLAEIANAPEVRERIGGLVLTGGDVAAKTCAALGATAFRLAGDVRPGLPWGCLEGGVLPGIPIAVKAGSFGDDRALVACIDHLANLPVRPSS